MTLQLEARDAQVAADRLAIEKAAVEKDQKLTLAALGDVQVCKIQVYRLSIVLKHIKVYRVTCTVLNVILKTHYFRSNWFRECLFVLSRNILLGIQRNDENFFCLYLKRVFVYSIILGSYPSNVFLYRNKLLSLKWLHSCQTKDFKLQIEKICTLLQVIFLPKVAVVSSKTKTFVQTFVFIRQKKQLGTF